MKVLRGQEANLESSKGFYRGSRRSLDPMGRSPVEKKEGKAWKLSLQNYENSKDAFRQFLDASHDAAHSTRMIIRSAYSPDLQD